MVHSLLIRTGIMQSSLIATVQFDHQLTNPWRIRDEYGQIFTLNGNWILQLKGDVLRKRCTIGRSDCDPQKQMQPLRATQPAYGGKNVPPDCPCNHRLVRHFSFPLARFKRQPYPQSAPCRRLIRARRPRRPPKCFRIAMRRGTPRRCWLPIPTASACIAIVARRRVLLDGGNACRKNPE
jgi:hypothetical protein